MTIQRVNINCNMFYISKRDFKNMTRKEWQEILYSYRRSSWTYKSKIKNLAIDWSFIVQLIVMGRKCIRKRESSLRMEEIYVQRLIWQHCLQPKKQFVSRAFVDPFLRYNCRFYASAGARTIGAVLFCRKSSALPSSVRNPSDPVLPHKLRGLHSMSGHRYPFYAHILSHRPPFFAQ